MAIIAPGRIDASRRRRGRFGMLCAMMAIAPVTAPIAVSAASFGPPMLDITGQCSTNSRRNVAAMSECIVAESEARAEILQKWHKVPDASAERCIKLGRKGQKFPYTKIAECLSAGNAAPLISAPTQPAPAGSAKTAPARTAPARTATPKL